MSKIRRRFRSWACLVTLLRVFGVSLMASCVSIQLGLGSPRKWNTSTEMILRWKLLQKRGMIAEKEYLFGKHAFETTNLGLKPFSFVLTEFHGHG